MFARVYPIIRLPRRFGFFDYEIPSDMIPAIGDVVRMPFHGRNVRGVVGALSEATDVRGKISVIETIDWRGALSESDISRVEHIAASIVQSPSTLFFHLFGTLHGDISLPAMVHGAAESISLNRDVAETVKRVLDDINTHHTNIAVQISGEGAIGIAQLLRKRINDQLLILVPRERDADVLSRTIRFDDATTVLHGKTSPRQRERIIRAWKNGTIRTLIGTRQASLIPAKKIGAVVVLSSGARDHFNDRRNPRLDTRNTAWLQAEQHAVHFVACDVLPRPEEFVAMPTTIFSAQTPTPTIIDLRARDTHSDSPLLSLPLIEAIKNALQSQKNVLLFYNRKGIAKRAQCRKCDAILCCDCGGVYGGDAEGLACGRCSKKRDMPEACPTCNDGIVALRGIGNAHVEASLTKLFPGITIARVEKGSSKTDARIQLVTEFFFSRIVVPFAQKTFGLVADLAIDLSMHPENFRSNEDTARNLHRLVAFATQQNAMCIVQTWLADDVREMCDAETFLKKESALRERYGLPPHRARITIRHADADALSQITGAYFAPTTDDTVEARIAPSEICSLVPLFTLPDTAVIAIDQTYDTTPRPPRTKS